MKAQENIRKLSPSSIETLYHVAFTHYQNGKYQSSKAIFYLLTTMDSRGRKHWMGLGASFQAAKQYQKALQAYEVAAALDPADFFVHLHAANCLFELGNRKEALFALDCADRAVNLNGANESSKHCLSHVALIRAAWDNGSS
jgi:type III secretion system low calcium response chaperone LcrH/SycD